MHCTYVSTLSLTPFPYPLLIDLKFVLFDDHPDLNTLDGDSDFTLLEYLTERNVTQRALAYAEARYAQAFGGELTFVGLREFLLQVGGKYHYTQRDKCRGRLNIYIHIYRSLLYGRNHMLECESSFPRNSDGS